MFKRILYTLHRVLGTLLSLLFLVWFLSGFVMIYRSFPRIQPTDRYRVMPPLAGAMLPPDSALRLLPDSVTVVGLRLQMHISGRPAYRIETPDSTYTLAADTLPDALPAIDFDHIARYAARWCNAGVARVDTLYQLEQWIPFGSLRNDMPIYKFYFADRQSGQLYVSSVTGEALQFTDRPGRTWAWLGAIPHWVYFTWLRQHVELWSQVVIWLAGAGCVVCLSGIVIGIRSYWLSYRRRRKFRTPYGKPLYRWHHIAGFFFGLFALTFAFSGLMSLADVPQWVAPVHNRSVRRAIQASRSVLPSNHYQTTLEMLHRTYGAGLKMVEWSSFGTHPICKAVVTDSLLTLDASTPTLRPLQLTEPAVLRVVRTIHPAESCTIALQTEYDDYYLSRRRSLPLPVYRVAVADTDRSVYYIDPQTGNVRYYNTNARVHKWSYQALHSFSIRWLVERPVLWHIVMFGALLGGTVISFTGVWLGLRYLRRKSRTSTRRNE